MTGRPRAPLAVAKATGADVKNPQRYRDRKAPASRALGAPPRRLTPEQVEMWEEYREQMPWLRYSHRGVLELAARLKARIMTDAECPVSVFAQLRLVLSSLGGTPVDETKVTHEDEGDAADPAAEFLN